mgnify:CR=1 FL=1
MYKGKTFIISGPSGVGKSTVLKELFEDRDDLYFSVSATTRPPRPGEINGVHYHFTNVDEFRKMISEDAFLEYAEYVGNFYGTPVKYVRDALERGEDMLLEIDVQGALQVMQRRPDAISVFIAPPSYAELKRRLAGRGDTPPDIAARRLHIALEECRQAKHYQYTIINDSVGHAVQELEAVLTAEACRTSYRPLNLKEED